MAMFTSQCFNCRDTVGHGPECSVCKCKFHFNCVGLTERGFDRLGTNRRSWRCPGCRDADDPAGLDVSTDKFVSPLHTPDTKRFSSGLPLVGASYSPTPKPAEDKSRDDKTPEKSPTEDEHPKQATLNEISSKISELYKQFSAIHSIHADLREVKSDLADLRTTLDLKFTEISDKVTSIETRVTQLESFKSEMECLRSEVKDLIESSRRNEQWVRRSNIQINGVPQRGGENLLQLVKTLANKSGYPINVDTDVDFVTRVAVKNDTDKRNPKPIILKMQSRYKKDDFMAALRKLKDLRSADLGYADENNHRIFINDHLSGYNKALLQKAKTIAKDKNYAFCWVRNCTVMARKSNTSPVIHVTSEEALKKIT